MRQQFSVACAPLGEVSTDMYEVPDAVPPIHAVSSHVSTDKDPSNFRSTFSNNLHSEP